MADICSEDHCYMMMATMRQFASAVNFSHAWTGMAYDREVGFDICVRKEGHCRAFYKKREYGGNV